MPVKKRQSRRYYSILKPSAPRPEGGLLRNSQGDEDEYFGEIEGIITSIELVNDPYDGKDVFKYHFTFEGVEHDGVDILQVGESSSAARGIITTLICCDDPIGWVSVSPFRKEVDGTTYSNVWVKVNGDTVDWTEEVMESIPDVEEDVNGLGEKTIDDGRRRLWLRKVAKHISEEKLAGTIVHEDGEQAIHTAESAGVKKADPQPNGKQQAEALHGAPEPPPPGKESDSNDKVDMDNWNDIEDDLPF